MPRVAKKPQDAQPTPDLTYKGYTEIMQGDPSNPSVKMSTGGYLNATYGAQSNATAPALLVNSPEFSGGLTAFNAIMAEAENKFKDTKTATDAIDNLFQNTVFPAGYNRSSYAEQIARLPKNVLYGASEETMKLLLAPKNAFSAINESFYEKGWQDTIANAYDQDPQLKAKMTTIGYTMANGQVRKELNDMSQHEIAISKVDNWKNADGSNLSETQKKLVAQYIRLNQRRDQDERRRLTMAVFGEEMQDKIYGSVDTLGDIESGPGKYGTMVGGIAASALIFGYGGAALNFAGAETAAFVNRTIKHLNKFGGRSFAKWALEHPVKADAFEFAAKAAKPLSYVLSGINGERFVFGMAFSRQYDDIRTEALAAGWSIEDANSIAFVAGMAEAGLEVPTFRTFSRYIKMQPSFRNLLLLEVLPEGLQEGAQTAAENLITNTYGLTDKQFSDVASECVLAMVMGGLGGGLMGSIHYKSVQNEAAEAAFQRAFELGAAKARQDIFSRKNPFEKQPPSDGFPPADKNNFSVEQANTIKDAKAQNSDEQAIIDQNRPNETAKYLGKDEDGNYVYQLGYLTSQEDQKLIGWHGVKINEQGEQVGEWEHQTRVSDSAQAEEEAYSVDKALTELKGYYERRVKKARPKITKKQLEAGWRQVQRLAMHEYNTGEFSTALNQSIDQMLAVIDGQNERFKTNIEELNQVLNGSVAAEDLQKLLSDDVAERHEAQWAVVETKIEDLFAQEGMPKQGKVVAKAFSAVWKDPLLFDSNVDPLAFYESVKPTILSVSRARRNGQEIAGAESVLEDVLYRKGTYNPAQGQSMATQIIQDFEIYLSKQSSEDAKKAAETRVKQALFGKYNKADMKMLYNALRNEADAEATLAHEMGIDLGNDLNSVSYLQMAIMRQMGFDQEQIDQAFAIEQEDANLRYQEALDAVMPPLKQHEIDSIEAMLAAGNEGGLNQEDLGVIEGMYNNLMNEIVLVNPDQLTAIHEGMHWIFDVINTIASDPGFATNIRVHVEESTQTPGVRLPTSTIEALNNSLRDTITMRYGSQTKITPRKMEETLVDGFFRWLQSPQNVNPELSRAFNDLINTGNVVYRPSADSLYMSKEFSKHRKANMKSAMANVFNPTAPQKTMQAVDKLQQALLGIKDSKNKQHAKDMIAQAMQQAIVDAGGAVPFELTTPVTIEQMRTHDEFSPYDMLDLATKLIDNMNEQAVSLAFANTELELDVDAITGRIMGKDNPANFKMRDYANNQETILYSRTGKPIEPELAMQGADFRTRAMQTLKSADKEAVGKSLRRIGESIATAARRLGDPMSAVVQKAGYDNAMRLVYADDLLVAIKDLINTQNEEARAGKGNYITAEMYKELKEYGTNDDRRGFFIWADRYFSNKDLGNKFKGLSQKYFASVDSAYAEMTSLGVDLAKITGYIPRAISKDKHEAFLQAINHGDDTSLSKMIREMEKKGASKQKIVDAINNMFRKTQGEQETSMFHHRVITEVKPDMLDYYGDPFEVMTDYLKSASATIMMRELTGDLMVAKDGQVQWGKSGRVGSMLLAYQKGKMGKYDPKAFDNFVERMKQLQKMNDTDDDFWSFVKNTQGLFALNSVTSTVTQLYELVPALYRFGMGDVAEAMVQVLGHKEAVQLFQIGINNDINEVQRLDDTGLWRKAQDLILTATGFKKMDQFMKAVVVNATLTNAKRLLSSTDTTAEAMEALDASIAEVLPEKVYGKARIAKMKEDILNNNITDDVSMWLRAQLSKTQPLDSIAAPANFVASGPLGKSMYFLSTTQLTQAGFLVGDMVKTYKTKGAAATAKKIARFLIFAAMVGVPTGMLIDLLCLRRPDPIQAAKYSGLQFFMINEYLVARAKRDGVANAVLGQMAPGFSMVDKLSKGQWQKLLPVFPQAFYNMSERGQKQLNRFNENLIPQIDLNFTEDLDWFGGSKWA